MTNVVPFGKYKGQPVEAMAADHQYMEWLTSQAWFRERHQNIYTLIVNNFHEPSETPEHNKLQAKFLDRNFVARFFGVLHGVHGVSTMTLSAGWDIGAIFETCGFDVLSSIQGDYANVEIKPTLADDYPAVLRQMKTAMKVNTKYIEDGKPYFAWPNFDLVYKFRPVLYINEYTGIGATLNDVRKIFAADHIKIITSRQVECE